MPFCPKCSSEFREGFSRCSDCDVELVDAVPEGSAAAGEAGEKMELLFRTASVGEIESLRLALQMKGIEAYAEDPAMGTQAFEMGTGGLSLYVPSRQMEEAREVLEHRLSKRKSDQEVREEAEKRGVTIEEEPGSPVKDEHWLWAISLMWVIFVVAWFPFRSGMETAGLLTIPLVVFVAFQLLRRRSRNKSGE